MPTLTNLPLATTASGSMIFAVVDGTATKRINIDAFKNYLQRSSISYTDVVGLSTIAHSGSYNDLLNKPATFSISTATATGLGGVKIGNGIAISGDGTISAASTYVLTTATSTVLGGVKIGNGIAITVDGTISAATTYVLTSATASVLGGVKIGNGIAITGTGYISVSTATASIIGGVKIGSGIAITGDGTISVAPTYVLTTATASVLGGVKIGSGIAITGNGTINLSTATASVLGGVKIGSGIAITGDGTINLSTATINNVGGVRVDGSSIVIGGAGIISAPLGLQSRSFVSTTTISLSSGTSTTSTITMAKGYALYAMTISTGSWITLYSSSATMILDYSRSITTDPAPGSGVIAEAITTTSGDVLFTPAVFGYNSDYDTNSNAYLKIYNNTKAATTVSVSIYYLKLEI